MFLYPTQGDKNLWASFRFVVEIRTYSLDDIIMDIALASCNCIFDPDDGFTQNILGIVFVDESARDNLGFVEETAVFVEGKADEYDTIASKGFSFPYNAGSNLAGSVSIDKDITARDAIA